ncbi:hypothetical protein CHLNCDRAFT_142806 [Chlorella variabilis]|uniref:CUE domain-containing protein n=1 Tax=Chlorella variabilis TaxID=554065 RepID=E1Z8S8_CHLVA|nr:hypothetical protein CHLNCDRAFT_142806 [Chlorella variabilis]EFN57660.1 hypothetical protein CHLNCDRAFT_142806 [Chlorella variabilis]|eukprot:XP_005849762.1 hypothetical protein CHLNCDRAFT_142806 [Chlorella variabilis]
MSVATQHSPFAVGSKRLYESEENEDHLQRLDSSAASHKRYRQRGSPSARCGGDSAAQHAYTVGHTTVTALRGLFPEMSDKVIADVLAEYGDNIDAAIKHLTDLRLSAASSSAAISEQAAAMAAAAAEQHQQQQQQQSAAEAPSSNGGGTATTAVPKSAEEWVDFVVHEMAAAKDMADARARASKVLQAFEQAAVQHSKHQGSAPDPERLRGQLCEAQRENQLLKRAVAIQNARLQELSGKEAEVAQLRQMLEGFQQKVHALEVQNYSLALHLKQAADGKDAMQAAGFKNNPDVF